MAYGGYADYTGYYFPAAASVTAPDYSSTTISRPVASGTSYRYVCTRFSGLKTSGTYDSLVVTFSCSGLTLTPSSDYANYRLQMRIVDGSYTSPWVDGTVSISASGWTSISSDGAGVLNNSSSQSYVSGGSGRHYLYVPSGTSFDSTIYIRIGLDMYLSQYVTSISVTAN